MTCLCYPGTTRHQGSSEVSQYDDEALLKLLLIRERDALDLQASDQLKLAERRLIANVPRLFLGDNRNDHAIVAGIIRSTGVETRAWSITQAVCLPALNNMTNILSSVVVVVVVVFVVIFQVPVGLPTLWLNRSFFFISHHRCSKTSQFSFTEQQSASPSSPICLLRCFLCGVWINIHSFLIH